MRCSAVGAGCWSITWSVIYCRVPAEAMSAETSFLARRDRPKHLTHDTGFIAQRWVAHLASRAHIAIAIRDTGIEKTATVTTARDHVAHSHTTHSRPTQIMLPFSSLLRIAPNMQGAATVGRHFLTCLNLSGFNTGTIAPVRLSVSLCADADARHPLPATAFHEWIEAASRGVDVGR
jgi:hypothetical protein